MYKIEVHNRINQLISAYYKVGIWHGDNCSKFRRGIYNALIFCLYLYYPISVFASAITGSYGEFLYLLVLSITGVVVQVRLYYLLYNQDKIIELIGKVGVHSIRYRETFDAMKNQIEVFMKYACFFCAMTGVTLLSYVTFALPIFSNEKRLPVPMYEYFTLNWRENEFIYWITFAFVTFELVLTFFSLLLTLVVWYVMMSCVVKYKVLGSEFKNCGLHREIQAEKKENISAIKKQDLFFADLIVLIKYHEGLRELTEDLKLCFANLYFVQIGTSGLMICCSVYNIAFNTPDSYLQYFSFFNVLLYEFFDIFVLTYYGNEIKFWSARLSYSFFKCNWMEQTEQCKKYITIIMEVLKRPQVLVVGKLYPLDLEIFTNILNFSYGMFNILKTLQQKNQ